MYCDARGHADPNGDFELINGQVCVRDGRGVGTSRFFMDKSADPKTIDEALRLRFAEMAKVRGTTVAEMLAGLEQRQIEEAATDVAKAFVSAQAGKGIASMFGDSVQRACSAAKAMRGEACASYLTDEERGLARSKAVRDWAMRHAHLGDQAPPLSAAEEAAALEDTATQKARRAARAWDTAQLTIATSSAQAGRGALYQAQKEQFSAACPRHFR